MGYSMTMNRRDRQERRTRDWRGFSIRDIDDIGFDPYDLEHALFQTEELCLYCVEREPYSLEYVRDKTEAVCLRALESDASAIQFIDEPTEETVAVSLDRSPGEMLDYVATQTPAICVAAVSRSSCVLVNVKAPTSEICVAAIVRSSQESSKATSFILRYMGIPFDVPMASALVSFFSPGRYTGYCDERRDPPVLRCLPEAAELLTSAGFEVAVEWQEPSERL